MDAWIMTSIQDLTIASAMAIGAFWIVRCNPILKTSLYGECHRKYDCPHAEYWHAQHLPDFGFGNCLFCKSATESSDLSLVAKANVHVQAAKNKKTQQGLTNTMQRFHRDERNVFFYNPHGKYEIPNTAVENGTLDLQLDALCLHVTNWILSETLQDCFCNSSESAGLQNAHRERKQGKKETKDK